MGTNTLNNRSAGQTIVDNFFNDIHQAMNADFVGRNATGVPTASQNLGTVAFPWGVVRADSMILGGSTVDPTAILAPPNRVISGKMRSTSNQPAFITPNGATLSLIVDGTPTNLVLDINGVSVAVSTDITKSGLTAAPSSQNTALVNDTDAADQHDTRLWGEEIHSKPITIDTVGTNISALVGKYAAFMLDNGSSTEYFIAFVESSTKLSRCRRGYFYDSSLNPKNRIFFSNNDTITLLSWGFVFVENDATTVDVTYTVPTWSFEQPTGPATGDYWYDMGNQVWKRYDGAAFQIINRVLVGSFVNSTTACVGARSEDFFASYSVDNTLDLEKSTTEIVKLTGDGQFVNVAGHKYYFSKSMAAWNITTDLAGSADMYNATEQSSRGYYLYVKDTGDLVISDISPYWRGDLLGAYHPHNPWRCVGAAYNDSSSNIQSASGMTPKGQRLRLTDTTNDRGATNTAVLRFGAAEYDRSGFIAYEDSAAAGTQLTFLLPVVCHGGVNAGLGTNADLGFSLNTATADLATTLSAITAASRIAYANTTSGLQNLVPLQRRFKIGDRLWPHQATGSVQASPTIAACEICVSEFVQF